MNNLRQAAEMALEALLICDNKDASNAMAAITALRAALAEEALQRLTHVSQEIEAALAEPEAWGNKKQCTYPQCKTTAGCSGACSKALNYAAPPQRKPLTEEQIRAIRDTYYRRMGPIEFARAIEAAHGIGDKK